jgi:protein-disulfide isomerase
MKKFKVEAKGMMKRLIVTGAIIVSVSALAWATDQSHPTSGFDAQQRREIESIIRQYILDHPEVIGEAIQKLQAQEQQAEEQRSREAASAVKPVGPDDHILGNPAAPVKLIEFSDSNVHSAKNFTRS